MGTCCTAAKGTSWQVERRMSESVSVHKLQIAREITKFNSYTLATFYYGNTYDHSEMLCTAWFAKPNVRRISVANEWMNVEKASAASISIGMAIEWLTEQGG
jgi:hypothetical protein